MIKRVICLDVGERRIGVAVSDPLGITAQPVKTIFTKGSENDAREVLDLARQYETDRILLGLPLSLSGDEGYQAGKVRGFAERLAGMQIRYYDERLTSKLAARTLIEGGLSRAKRKKNIDKIAAVYILQSFLDSGGWRENKSEDM
ncbi:MAG: Holliday junction resolvase RuvX [Clostridia bacterium]|nr:Holliday junction resolvase RuvX [Clostridia bacterium]